MGGRDDAHDVSIVPFVSIGGGQPRVATSTRLLPKVLQEVKLGDGLHSCLCRHAPATHQEVVEPAVVDGVAAGVKLAEALVGMGLGTSKHGDNAAPLPKHYIGLAQPFSPR